MGRKKEMKELASIIKNFRKGELDVKLDEEHVERWLSQFSEESQGVILTETTRIFSRWYFNRDYIKEEFLDTVIDELMQRYSFQSIDDLCNNVVFISMQKIGQSQKILVDMLEKRLAKKYDVSLQKKATDGQRIFVYLDDGLYTGSRARKDIAELLNDDLRPGDSLDVFYMIASRRDANYSARILWDTASSQGISFRIRAYNCIENDRMVSSQSVLWPSEALKQEEEAYVYEGFLDTIRPTQDCYRDGAWDGDPGIFSSAEARYIVEREFLRKGIDIYYSMSDPKGTYPLGYGLWPSFGYGAFCASDLNIPNTCPLVLWWGNLEEHSDALDIWYPLLPRRTNPKADGIEPCAW